MRRATSEVESEGDAALYESVARTLQAGLVLSLAVMAVGLALAERQGRAQTSQVLPLDRIVPGLLRGDSAAVLDTGIILLFLSPLVGIVVAFAGFYRPRDVRFMTVATALILMALAGIAVAVK